MVFLKHKERIFMQTKSRWLYCLSLMASTHLLCVQPEQPQTDSDIETGLEASLPTPDLAKINSSKEKPISFAAIDARIAAIENHMSAINTEIANLKNYINDIKDSVSRKQEKQPEPVVAPPTPKQATDAQTLEKLP
jgi:hypothetical protein